ncbi:MAG: tRNA pseudouridine(55) synthase TruB [Acidimicrobiales bacterium]
MARRSKNDSGAVGCLIIDKPAGCTSHDVVDIARKALQTRRVGHAGTLDPDATGVLVLGVGLGTKLLQFITGASKTYTGEVVFGQETSTLDAGGEVTATHEMVVRPEAVAAASVALTGDILQVPPMVSAIRVGGKRLHELAREGIEVEREARPVHVSRFDTEPTDDPLVYRIDVDVSSGTYVRTLAADLGHELGGGAHLRNLRRTSVGAFTIEEACSLDALELRPITDLVRGMPIINVDETVAQQVKNGRALGPSTGSGRLAVAGPDGMLLAVYEVQGGQLKPAKVLIGN